MGKPFRVKRNGKEIGRFKARAKGGKVVNLQTCDAETARKRARAVVRGDYSWRKEIADDVKSVLDGSGGEPDSSGAGGEPEPVEATPVQAPAEVSEGDASSKPETAGTESGPTPAVSGPPLPTSDPVAAANDVAAAQVAGVAVALQDAARTVGIDLAELSKPETLGGIHLAAQSWLAQQAARIFVKKEIQPLSVPKELASLQTSLGEAWKAQMALWGISVVNVPPIWAILGCTAVFVVVQVAASIQVPAKEGEGDPAVSGAV